MTHGVVVFYADKENPLRMIPRGTINQDGTYELNTEGRSGVPIGSYIACVRGPMRKVNSKEPPRSPSPRNSLTPTKAPSGPKWWPTRRPGLTTSS